MVKLSWFHSKEEGALVLESSVKNWMMSWLQEERRLLGLCRSWNIDNIKINLELIQPLQIKQWPPRINRREWWVHRRIRLRKRKDSTVSQETTIQLWMHKILVIARNHNSSTILLSLGLDKVKKFKCLMKGSLWTCSIIWKMVVTWVKPLK